MTVSAEELATGSSGIQRGGISSNTDARGAGGAQQKRDATVVSQKSGRSDTSTGSSSAKTLISLNFGGMIPENNCQK